MDEMERKKTRTPREILVDKVKSLLAKTTENKCTEEEMLAALAKARALIDAYEITDDELKLSRDEKAILHTESEVDARDSYGIKWQLGHSVARYCHVEIFRNGSKSGLSFVGFKSDIDFAIWLIDHLADFVHGALFEFLLDCLAPEGRERKAEIRGFISGCTQRISARLDQLSDQSQTERTTSHKALVVIKDQAIKDFMKAEGICLRLSRSGSGGSEGARSAGRSAGDRASFGRPVSGAGATPRLGKN
jgi:hypothetical protein